MNDAATAMKYRSISRELLKQAIDRKENGYYPTDHWYERVSEELAQTAGVLDGEWMAIARNAAKRIKWEQSHSIHEGGYDVNLFTNILAAIRESHQRPSSDPHGTEANQAQKDLGISRAVESKPRTNDRII